MINLTDVYPIQMKRLTDGLDPEWTTFSPENFRTEQPEIRDELLVVNIGEKSYHPSPDRIDRLHFHLSYKSCKALGLLFVSAAFNLKKIQISLQNGKSKIKKITIAPYEKMLLSGRYKIGSVSFEYFPETLKRHSLEDVPSNVPSFFLVLEDEEGFIKPEEYEKRDTVLIAGSPESLLFLAQIFFDMGNANQEVSEMNLERPFAFGGVGNTSAEVRLYTEKDEFFMGGGI